MSSSTAETTGRLPVVILLSGSGSNFAAIAAAAGAGSLPIDVRAAVSDRPAAFGLERARALGIPAEAVPVAGYADRAAHNVALAARIDTYQPALVVCAGYMRIFTAAFVEHYADRMLNIHPSLLPEFRGLHTHERALETGARWHGCIGALRHRGARRRPARRPGAGAGASPGTRSRRFQRAFIGRSTGSTRRSSAGSRPGGCARAAAGSRSMANL